MDTDSPEVKNFDLYTVREIPDEIRERYFSWKPVHDDYVRYGNECLELFQNDVEGTHTNYTQKQYKTIKNKTNIPVAINHLYPAVSQKLAIMCLTKPSSRVVSFDGRYKDYAAVLDKCCTAVMRNSVSQLQAKARIKDALVIGMGHEMALPQDFFSDGEFGVSEKYQPVENIILDINSKDESGQDMEGFFVEKKITATKAAQIYGHILPLLRYPDGSPLNYKDLTDFATVFSEDITLRSKVISAKKEGTIHVREYYDKVFTTMYLYEGTDGSVQRLFAENLPADGQALLGMAQDKRDGIYVRRFIMMGDKLIHIEVIPITQFPLVTSYFEWGGSPYKSYGMVHYAKGMQEASDKFLQMMILNGILQNSPNTKSPKGAIAPEDKSKWAEHGNDPGVIKEYIPQTIDGQTFIPEKEPVQPLSNFYPLMMQMMKAGVDESTGISAVMQGNAEAAKIEIFSSLQQYQDSAMKRIQFAIDNLNPSNEQLSTVILEYIIANLKPEQKFIFFDEKGKLNEMQIAYEMARDITMGRYKVMTVPGVNSPSQRLATSNTLASLAQSSPDPATRNLLTNKAMELADIPGMDDLLQQIDVVSNLSQQVQQAQDTIKQLEYENQKMKSKVVETSIQNEILKQMHSSVDAITTAEAETKKQMEIDALNEKLKNQDSESQNQ